MLINCNVSGGKDSLLPAVPDSDATICKHKWAVRSGCKRFFWSKFKCVPTHLNGLGAVRVYEFKGFVWVPRRRLHGVKLRHGSSEVADHLDLGSARDNVGVTLDHRDSMGTRIEANQRVPSGKSLGGRAAGWRNISNGVGDGIVKGPQAPKAEHFTSVSSHSELLTRCSTLVTRHWSTSPSCSSWPISNSTVLRTGVASREAQILLSQRHTLAATTMPCLCRRAFSPMFSRFRRRRTSPRILDRFKVENNLSVGWRVPPCSLSIDAALSSSSGAAAAMASSIRPGQSPAATARAPRQPPQNQHSSKARAVAGATGARRSSLWTRAPVFPFPLSYLCPQLFPSPKKTLRRSDRGKDAFPKKGKSPLEFRFENTHVCGKHKDARPNRGSAARWRAIERLSYYV